MEMSSEQRIEASRDRVWAALNDTEVLRQAMPGCESFEAAGENQFNAKITAKVGPVKARFTFKVELSNIDPPTGYTISGEGQGGAAGFAKGSAAVRLREEEGATVLAYEVKANVGGKLAQLGARLIDGTAKKMADEFFENFTDLLSSDGTASEQSAAAADGDLIEGKAGKELPTWVWATAVLLLLALILAAIA